MKIITLNIWMGRLGRGLLRYVAQEQPDVLCMQEVFAGDTIVPIPDRMFDILRRIQEIGEYPHVYFSPRYSIDIAGRETEYGNAILSKHPISSSRVVACGGEPLRHVSEDNQQKNITNLQLVTVESPEGSATVANHHGYHVGSSDVIKLSDTSLGDENSVAAMEHVVAELRKVEGPLVMCGDLNVRPESPAMRCYDGFLRNLTAEHGIATTLNKLNVDIDVPCDYILVNDFIEVTSFRRGDEIISDHYPLVMECALR